MEKNEALLKKITDDFEYNIVMTKRYISLDEKDNIIITFDQAKLINKDFIVLYMNWNNFDGGKKVSKTIKSNKNLVNENNTFKPKISEKSRELYSGYRKKIMNVRISLKL